MAEIYRSFFVEEVTAIEGNTSKIFVNADHVYRKIKAIFINSGEEFEIGGGIMFVRDVNGWVNLDTGEVINN